MILNIIKMPDPTMRETYISQKIINIIGNTTDPEFATNTYLSLGHLALVEPDFDVFSRMVV